MSEIKDEEEGIFDGCFYVWVDVTKKYMSGHWDTVLCNSPFGSVIRDSDLPFLENIFNLGDYIYLIHNWKAKDFVLDFARNRSTVLDYTKKRLSIPNMYSHHEKDWAFIDILFLYAKSTK